ncbi:glycosyltransferase family 4 protein [Clostridium sp. CX1]|uniref:glycosyltransferase family 4 protein n=1 Tax=Clostridium sp. CX1 TaxID=2978346 RepID=UPI0021C05CB2|nr:glycosyltransferase family 4 protein [Clostridium sp. CX1]MCT8975973.1 glycosyltransferase family 4 protein [Clostridium sp. CX1]
MRKHNIAIIGNYPPPIGGVSVHIERLAKNLKEKNVDYIVYDISKKKKYTDLNVIYIKSLKMWIIKYLFSFNNSIVHCHEKNWYLLFILCIITKLHKAKLILTLHSFRENVKEFNFIKRKIFNFCIRNIDCFIAVGENEKNKIIKYGGSSSKIEVIPPYINPRYSNEDDKKIPQYVWEFINNKDICILANAFKISFYKNEDLYGLDMCVELCKKLKDNYKSKSVGIIFCLPDIGHYQYYNKIKNEIVRLDLNDDFLIVNENIPMYPITRRCHIFIRPTNTDSYGLSIAEAIHYNIPSIASDVCKRPRGTILFQNRNIEDLYLKVLNVLEDYNKAKEIVSNIKIYDNLEELLNLYNSLNKDLIQN